MKRINVKATLKATLTILTALVISQAAQATLVPTCASGPVICTREYRPTYCHYENRGEKRSARGSNPCGAKANLKKILCQMGITQVDSEAIQCVGEVVIPVNDKINPCSSQTAFCTREFMPTVCSYNRSYPTSGNNRCQARNSLLKVLCDKNFKTVDASGISCGPRH